MKLYFYSFIQVIHTFSLAECVLKGKIFCFIYFCVSTNSLHVQHMRFLNTPGWRIFIGTFYQSCCRGGCDYNSFSPPLSPTPTPLPLTFWLNIGWCIRIVKLLCPWNSACMSCQIGQHFSPFCLFLTINHYDSNATAYQNNHKLFWYEI